MESTITLELSQAEVNALQQLIHIAVQARGMEVAEAGVVLSKKIKDATEAAAKPTKPQQVYSRGAAE